MEKSASKLRLRAVPNRSVIGSGRRLRLLRWCSICIALLFEEAAAISSQFLKPIARRI